jgi:hypothetical protein
MALRQACRARLQRQNSSRRAEVRMCLRLWRGHNQKWARTSSRTKARLQFVMPCMFQGFSARESTPIPSHQKSAGNQISHRRNRRRFDISIVFRLLSGVLIAATLSRPSSSSSSRNFRAPELHQNAKELRSCAKLMLSPPQNLNREWV